MAKIIKYQWKRFVIFKKILATQVKERSVCLLKVIPLMQNPLTLFFRIGFLRDCTSIARRRFFSGCGSLYNYHVEAIFLKGFHKKFKPYNAFSSSLNSFLTWTVMQNSSQISEILLKPVNYPFLLTEEL